MSGKRFSIILSYFARMIFKVLSRNALGNDYRIAKHGRIIGNFLLQREK